MGQAINHFKDHGPDSYICNNNLKPKITQKKMTMILNLQPRNMTVFIPVLKN